MALGPETAGGANPAGWLEGFGAFLLLLLTLGTQAYRYLKESMKQEPPPNHMVLETAELADMRPLRVALLKLDQILALKADVDEMRKSDAKILELLERMDREDEIGRKAEEMAARMFADRREAEERARRDRSR